MISKLVFILLLLCITYSFGKQQPDMPQMQTTEGSISSMKLSALCAGKTFAEKCIQLGDKIYLIETNEKRNWFSAASFCRRQNGHLAHFENAQELDVMLDYLRSKNYNGDDSSFYIAGNDLETEGIFNSIATDELMPYTRWLPGEPTNGFGGEHCVHLWKVHGIYAMNDERCTNIDHYICELRYPTLIY